MRVKWRVDLEFGGDVDDVARVDLLVDGGFVCW